MRKLLASLILALSITSAMAITQFHTGQVSIGTKSLDAASMLQINSTTQGFLPSRMTLAQRDAIGTPPTGLIIFNTTDATLDIFNGGTWVPNVGGSVSAWLTSIDYKIGRVVHESNMFYLALTDHTSGTFATDYASNDWVELSAIDFTNNPVTGVLAVANGGSASSAALTSDLAMRSNGTAIIESSVTLNATGDIGGVTSLQVDNINLNGDTITNTVADNPLIIDATGEGEVDLIAPVNVLHVATQADEYSLEIETNAAGYGDIKALDIDYITGAIADGQDEEVVLINIDESLATGGDVSAIEVLATTGSANIFGLFAGINVAPIEQLSGTFGDMDSALVGAVDRLTEFTTAANIEMFTSDNDIVTIGDAAKFEEIEFILATFASKNIRAVWEFSTGSGTWTAFTPADGTNGFKNTGVVAWLDGDIPTWAVGAGTEYLIRITRTRNGSITSPIEELVQIGAGAEYKWDKDANVVINDLTANDLTLAALSLSDLTADLPVLTDGSKNLVSGQIDQTTDITGIVPPANGGTGTTALTQNSIPFIGASGVLSENTNELLWDDAATKLKIGTGSYSGSLMTVNGTSNFSSTMTVSGTGNFDRLATSSTTTASVPYPAMTETQRDAVALTPQAGSGVYNTTTDKINTWNTTDAAWEEVGGGAGGSRLNLIIDNSFEKGVTEGTCTSCTATQELTIAELTDTNTASLKIAIAGATGYYLDTTATSSQYTGVVGKVSARIKTDQENIQFCSVVDAVESACVDVSSGDVWDTYAINSTMGPTSFGYIIKATANVTGNVYADEIFAGSNPIETVVTQGADIALSSQQGAAQAVTSGNTITFTESRDTDSAYSSGVFTAPETGDYSVASMLTSASVVASIGNLFTFKVMKNTSTEVGAGTRDYCEDTGSRAYSSNYSGTIYLLEGETLEIVFNESLPAVNLNTQTRDNHFHAFKKSNQNKAVIVAVDDDSMTDWVTFTPAFVGFTISGGTLRWRKVGSNMEIDGYFTLNSAVTTTMEMQLPNGVTADGTSSYYWGSVIGYPASSGFFDGSVAPSSASGGTTYGLGGIIFNTASGESAAAWGNTTPATWASGNTVVFKNVSIPIVGWSARSTALATVPVEENSSEVTRIRGNANGHGSTNTKIRRFDTVTEDTSSDLYTYANTAADGVSFTALKRIQYTASYKDSGSTGGIFSIGLSKNSTQLTTSITTISTADMLTYLELGATDNHGSVAWSGILEIGDVIRPHTDASNVGGSGGSFGFVARPANLEVFLGNVIPTEFVQTPSAVKPVLYSATVEATVTTCTFSNMIGGAWVSDNTGSVLGGCKMDFTAAGFSQVPNCTANISNYYNSISENFNVAFKSMTATSGELWVQYFSSPAAAGVLNNQATNVICHGVQ